MSDSTRGPDGEPRRNAPEVHGPPGFAARARTAKGVWFTVGQGWAFDEDGVTGYVVRLAMTPTAWDGEHLSLHTGSASTR